MNTSSPFQLILLGVFGLLGAGGVLFFALGGGLGGTTEEVGPVLIWGTLDQAPFEQVISSMAEDDRRLAQVAYERHDARNFYNDLANAIASGRGPDLILISQEYLVQHADKVLPIPYEDLPRRTFEDSFIDEGSLFLTDQGVLGIPIAVDPLVMYWNKDMVAAAGYALAPQYWDELFTLAERITKRDDANNIQKSVIAFGEYQNVAHAKDILAALILQAGGEITYRDSQGRIVPSLASTNAEKTQQPAQSALRFYTEFANPSKSKTYSWNRSLPNSRDAFAAGDVALYIGFASELGLLRSQNPNLNLGVAPIPQIRGGGKTVTYAEMQAFAIPRGSLNVGGARLVAFVLAAASPSQLLASVRGTPSPNRQALIENAASTTASTADAVFRDAALISRGWYDPNPIRTEQVFRGMIEGVTSGALRLGDAILEGDKALLELVNL